MSYIKLKYTKKIPFQFSIEFDKWLVIGIFFPFAIKSEKHYLLIIFILFQAFEEKEFNTEEG